MKKFSKITEKVEFEESRMRKHPAVDPEDWAKLQQLKQAIGSSDVYGQSTAKALRELIERMNVDAMIAWQRKRSDSGFDEFFKLFDIRTDEDEIKDCVRSIIDNSDYISEDSDENRGEFYIKMADFRYAEIDELIEDVKDAHGKLGMIDGIDFKIAFQMRTRDIMLPKKLYGGRNPNIDSWFELNGFMAQRQINQIIDIRVYVWNPETRIYITDRLPF
jgi:hypothetical protein